MSKIKLSPFIETALPPIEAAQYIGVSVATLNRWRYKEVALGVKQPRYYKVGIRIFYQRKDLDAFLKSCVVARLDKNH